METLSNLGHHIEGIRLPSTVFTADQSQVLTIFGSIYPIVQERRSNHTGFRFGIRAVNRKQTPFSEDQYNETLRLFGSIDTPTNEA